MSKSEVKRMILEFPHGESVAVCDKFISTYPDHGFRSGISEGGYTVKFMPMTKEEEETRGIEFAEDELTYVFGHLRKK